MILWSWPGGVRIGALPHPAEVTALAFGVGNLILTGCADGQVRSWRLQGSGKALAPLLFSQAHEGAVRAVALSPDGSTCATGGDDKRIGVWEVATGAHRQWLQSEEGLPAHQGAVTSLSFAPDGRLISAGRDNVLKIWALDGKLVRVHPGRTGEVTNLGISPDGRHVLLDMGEELRVLDRERGTRVGSLQNQKQGRFQAFAHFSPSGRLVLTASSNSRLQLWRAPATAEEAQFCRCGYAAGFHRGTLLALSAIGSESHLGRLTAASSSSAAPKLWQLSGPEVRHFVVPGGTNVNCGAFAPDESVILTGGSDKAVRVWSVPSASIWSQPRRPASPTSAIRSSAAPTWFVFAPNWRTRVNRSAGCAPACSPYFGCFPRRQG